MTKKKSSANKPPAPCGNPGVWFGDRKAFLDARLPAFLDWGHAVCKKFTAQVTEDYLAVNPYHLNDCGPTLPEGATEEEKAESDRLAREGAKLKAGKQIHSYYKNKRTKAVAAKKQPFHDFLKNGLRAVISRKPRRDEEAKFWMKYDEWRPKFAEEFEQRWAKADRPEKQRLAYRVEVARDMYEKEDDEVKERVQKLVAADYERRIQEYELALDTEGSVNEETSELCRANLAVLLEPLLQEVLRMVHVGQTIPSEGGLKLPLFDPEGYTNIFLRFFMKFAIMTSEKSLELHRQEQAKHAPQEAPPQSTHVDETPASSLEPDGDTPASNKRKPRRRKRSSRRDSRRTRNVDAMELSDDETSSESGDDWTAPATGDSGDQPEQQSGWLSDGADSDTPLVDVVRGAKRGRFPLDTTERDEFGIPLQDAKGRELTPELREYLSRMSIVRRMKTLHDISTGSDYEFNRHCNIARNHSKIRQQLDEDGMLHRGDAFYGDVTPRKVARVDGILTFVDSPTSSRPQGGRDGGSADELEGGRSNERDDEGGERSEDERGEEGKGKHADKRVRERDNDRDDERDDERDEHHEDGRDDERNDERDDEHVNERNDERNDEHVNERDDERNDEHVNEHVNEHGGLEGWRDGEHGEERVDENANHHENEHQDEYVKQRGGEQVDNGEGGKGGGEGRANPLIGDPNDGHASGREDERGEGRRAYSQEDERGEELGTRREEENRREERRGAGEGSEENPNDRDEQRMGGLDDRGEQRAGSLDERTIEHAKHLSARDTEGLDGHDEAEVEVEDELMAMLEQEGVSWRDLEGEVSRARKNGRVTLSGGMEVDTEGNGASHRTRRAAQDALKKSGTHRAEPATSASTPGPHGKLHTPRNGLAASSSGKRRREGRETYANPFTADRSAWEAWFAHGVDNLALDSLSEGTECAQAWVKAVGTWWKLEELDDYKGSKKLPKGNSRPDDIPAWIKHHRRVAYAPKVPKNVPPQDFLDDWKTSMWQWWSELNPPWRTRLVDGKVSGREAGDWSKLDCRGVNGHLSVLKGLAWWFELEGKPEGSRAWQEIVEDVQWVLERVLQQRRQSNEGGRPNKRQRT
ncbi:hypothetical protein EV715DRAFT_295471 [Schizophyllum commune]